MGNLKPKKPVRKIRKVKKIKPVKRIKVKKVRDVKDVGTSAAEWDFMVWLKAIGVDVQKQFRINYKFYDFKVKGTKLIIEFDGDYWHCNPSVYPNGPINNMQKEAVINDRYKNALAADSGYTVLRVWEKDFKENRAEVKKRVLAEVRKSLKSKSN